MGWAGVIHFSVRRHFPHDIILFLILRLKYLKKKYNLHIFTA